MTEEHSNPQDNLRTIATGGGTHQRQLTEDADLLAKISRRDSAAMTVLFDRYSRLVYSIAFRVLKDAAASEDVTQEIFFQIWQSPHTFESRRGALHAWLAVVTRNRAVDLLRRRKPTEPVDEIVLTSSINTADDAQRRLMMEHVRAHWGSLPSEQQNSLELAFFEGLSHAEIAAQTGTPLGTVKTRIRSALLSLRGAVS